MRNADHLKVRVMLGRGRLEVRRAKARLKA